MTLSCPITRWTCLRIQQTDCKNQRRRIKTKVVAAVWGEDFVKFLSALTILPRTIFKNRINSSSSFKSSWCNSSHNSNRPVQNSKCGKEFNKLFPPNRSDERPLPLLLSLSFFYGKDILVRKLLGKAAGKCFKIT